MKPRAHRRARWLAMCTLVLAAAGARMSGGVRDKDRGAGTEKVYPVSSDQAWKIAQTILQMAGTDAVQEHRSEGYMLTSADVSPLSPGTYMGVWVEPTGPGMTKVTFVRKRKVATQAITTLT